MVPPGLQRQHRPDRGQVGPVLPGPTYPIGAAGTRPAGNARSQPVNRPRIPFLTSVGRCCSPANELTTTRAPVRAGTSHCSTFSCLCALATSAGVATLGSVPDSTGTSPCVETLRPSTRLYAVTASAATVRDVLTTTSSRRPPAA